MGFKDTFFSRNLSINCHGNLLDLSVPGIMGILNVTPDSFYDGGNYTQPDAIKDRIIRMVEEGADIIDVGAYSSRPGSSPVSEDEEKERLFPALEILRKEFPEIPVSADTYRARIAEKIVKEYRVDIINDITGGNGDPDMFGFIADSKTPYILMHMQGTPETMQKSPSYGNVVNEVLSYLNRKSAELLGKGALDIIVDPGFGFGKTMDHNFNLMASLEVFTSLEMPLLVGVSRKSMTYKFLGVEPGSSLNGTTALHMYALIKGVSILRVHDVKEAFETRKLYMKLHEAENES